MQGFEQASIFSNIYKTFPIGGIGYWFSPTPPKGFLICDGSVVNISQHPECVELSKFLGYNGGNFTLPDFRECALVGANRNATHSIETHDVFSVGQFKDDQLQSHQHYVRRNTERYKTDNDSVFNTSVSSNLLTNTTTEIESLNENGEIRFGNTTCGKGKGVYLIIRY